MRSVKLRVSFAVALAVALAGVGVASATSGSSERQRALPTNASRATAHASARHSLAVFRKSFHPSARQLRERAEIAREFHHAGSNATIASADLADSRAVPINGGTDFVWLAPSADGGVCTFIPDPEGGYGAACTTMGIVNAGHAMSSLGGSSTGPLAHQAIVAIVEPDGAGAPTVRSLDGHTSELPITSNVATGYVPLGATVVSGKNVIVVPAATTPKCAVPDSGAAFKRCSV
jgi:hypothetical protein